MNKKVIYVAHRGSKLGKGVENTHRAYMDGVEHKYQALETDIRVTKDGVYVISHDNTLTRLTQNSDKHYDFDVNQSNYNDIKDIELSEIFKDELRSGDKICLFEDYLDICKKNNVIPIIELKWANGIYSDNTDPNNHDYSNLDGVIELVKKYGLEDTAYIMTSMLGCLDYVHKKYPNIKLQWLCNRMTKLIMPWCAERGINIDVEYTYCDEEVVKYCHDHGLLVNIWTLDNEELLDKYLNMGVDMITTNTIVPR